MNLLYVIEFYLCLITGGVVIMWHKRLSHFITYLSIDDDRIVGIQLQIAPSVHASIFQVYLPCSNHSVAVYKQYIDKLYDLHLYSDQGIPIFLGGYNA